MSKPEGAPIVIGAAPDCDVRVDGEYVSAHHARIVAGPEGQWWVEDLGSTNGTTIRRGGSILRVQPSRALRPGDIIVVGRMAIPWPLQVGTTVGKLDRADLDRCLHGRHAVDNCLSCPDGWSTGNLFLRPGQRIGTDYAGVPILVGQVWRNARAGDLRYVPPLLVPLDDEAAQVIAARLNPQSERELGRYGPVDSSEHHPAQDWDGRTDHG